ncbi:MAG TPA: PhzF family phenazine biosynthesis protein [Candidatus Binatia bacterium]|nr:PhzF family phenazine biosynthesis protein [Candidatus Binatia bacterium]
MQNLRFKQVDVFTQKPFLGNPVAVVIGAEGLATEAMQRIAAWTNLSETTFVLPPSSGQADYRLRIFTPRQELPFAGHPTVGSAHAVIESGFAKPRARKLRQECLAGLIELTVEDTESGKRILVQAPQAKVSQLIDNHNHWLASALGAAADSSHPPLRVDVGVVWLVANLGNAGAVAKLKPDLDTLLKISHETSAAGVTVFGRSDDGYTTLHVRSFAPALGVPEDPVCGSGNAGVAAFLLHTGMQSAFGSSYIARQGMQVGRDGRVAVRINGESIQIGGYAVTCVDGSLRVQ